MGLSRISIKVFTKMLLIKRKFWKNNRFPSVFYENNFKDFWGKFRESSLQSQKFYGDFKKMLIKLWK